jgi:hypothetical protein
MPTCSRRSPPADAIRLTSIGATRLLLVLLLAAPASSLAAQGPVQRADDLLRVGRVAAAESLYYAAVSLTPRDPVARHALGRYLVARGRLKIGATLIEEARFFGGNVRTAAEALAPVYAAMHDYRALAALPSTPLSAAERQRVIWLRDNPPGAAGSDSAVVRLHAGSGSAIGRIPVRIAGEETLAAIDPTITGIVLDTTWMPRAGIRRFPISSGGDLRRTPIVVQELSIGGLLLRNVPAQLDRASGVAIGLDVLGALNPTFDPGAEMLVIRRTARLPRARGDAVPTIVQPDGWYVAPGGGLLPLHGADARELLNGRRWTIHAKRGVLLLER